MVYCHVKLLCRADREQRETPMSPLPRALRVGPGERTPVPLEVNTRPTWFPAVCNVCGGCVCVRVMQIIGGKVLS